MTGPVWVLGAGIAGLCVATELVARGVALRLVDPAGGPGSHGCSWWAGGMLAPECEGETAEPVVVRLGAEAAAWWQAQGVPVARTGSIAVSPARDRAELDRFARRTAGHHLLDRDGLARLEPGLAERFERALYFTDEAHLNPRQALAHLRARLQAAGVTIEARGSPPAGARVIDCRGLAAAADLPGLRGVRGEMAVLRAPDVRLGRTVRLLHPRHRLYVVPRGDGVFMLGATQIESAHRGPATLRSAVEMLSAAYALDPAFGEAEILELGADARPAFADNLPRLLRRGDRLHVNGLFRHGYLMAPALAQRAARLIAEGTIPNELFEDLC